MFNSMRRRLRSIAMLGVAAALVVGGVAAAQSDSGGDAGGSGQNGKAAGKLPPGPPMLGLAMPGLTYAELHVQTKDGEAETIRIDQGKVKSVGSGSITLTANDDSEVTIAVDADTEVLGKPGEESSLDDLETGQQVSVSGPEGEAAKAIMAVPKKGDVLSFKGAPKGAPMGPPPGAPALGRSE